MALIENKWMKYIVADGILLVCIWVFGLKDLVSWKWKVLFSFGALFGSWLYLEGYMTNIRRRR